jgi:hypothetical protein
MIYGDHHPPLWLRDHSHVPTLEKIASNRGRRTALTNTLTAKKGQSNRSKKREALSRDSPTKASKKKKTTAARASGSRGVVIQEATV